MILNTIDITILTFTFTINFFGILINNFERYAPGFVNKAFYYGNVANSGTDVQCLRHIAVPKSYFAHFYAYSSIINGCALIYLILVLFFNVDVNEHVRRGLQTLLQEDEPVSATAALTTMVLFTLQCLRRLHETLFLQVFAKSSKMNVAHYLIAMCHYTLCVASIVGKAPLFCGNQSRAEIPWIDINTIIAIVPSTVLFIWAAYEQHQSNIILANLRKNKETGHVTEEYRIPCGRLFKYVSSPHRFCEMVIYLSLMLMMQTKSYACILVWVVSNQIQGSVAAHQWYKKTFENYPAERYVIFPYLL